MFRVKIETKPFRSFSSKFELNRKEFYGGTLLSQALTRLALLPYIWWIDLQKYVP